MAGGNTAGNGGTGGGAMSFGKFATNPLSSANILEFDGGGIAGRCNSIGNAAGIVFFSSAR